MNLNSTIETLQNKEILNKEQSIALYEINSNNRFSLYLELRILIYLGVLCIASGTGLVIKEYYQQIGHITIITALTTLFISAFIYSFLKANKYSNEQIQSRSIFFDYVLLFGCLVYSLDIAYIETHFRLLKELWENYLLFSSLIFFIFAYRFDNRFVLSLALSTLAAWFGFELSGLKIQFIEYHRIYAIIYGFFVLFVGFVLYYKNIKKHFLNIYLNFALNFLFIAFVSGVFKYKMLSLYFPALLILCAAMVFYAIRSKSFLYLVYAIIYGYIGISNIVIDILKRSNTLIFLYFIISAILVMYLIFHISHKFKEDK